MTYASWSPLYDVRADVDSQLASRNQKDRTPTINIQYRASISQSTGEDWNDVILTLSTASHLAGTEIPTLRGWNIGRAYSHQVVPATISYDGNSDKPEHIHRRRTRRRQYSNSEDSRSPRRRARRSLEDRERRRSSDTDEECLNVNGVFSESLPQVNEGAVGSTFGIEGLSTIPSGGSSHKVSITVRFFPSNDLGAPNLTAKMLDIGFTVYLDMGYRPEKDTFSVLAMPYQEH